MRPTLIGLILFTTAACGGNGSQTVALDEPLHLKVDGATAGIARMHLDGATGVVTTPGPVIASVSGGDPGATNDLSFAPTLLTLDLRTVGERVALGELRLPLGDLRVFAPSLPAGGLQLRDLALELPATTKLEVVRKSSDVLSLRSDATALSLAWKLQLPDGSLYALGPVAIGPVELHVAASQDEEGALSVQLVAMCPDACGGVDGLFTLRDGLVWTKATATAQAIE